MRKFLRGIRATLLTKIGQATQLVVLGQMLNGLIGFGVNVLLIRRLTVDDYGLFSLFNSTLILLTGFMHFGWLETFVRFGAKYRKTPDFEPMRQLIFNRVMAFSLLVALVTAISAPWVANDIYHRPLFLNYVFASIAGAWVTTVFNFAMIYHRALERFREYFIGQFGPTLLRGIFCASLLPLALLKLKWVTLIYLLSPVLFCGPALAPARGLVRRATTALSPEVRVELFQYNKWILVSSMLFMLTGNINTQILARYHNDVSIGDFGAISRLTLPIYFLTTAIATTVLPRLSASPEHAHIRKYLQRLSAFLIPGAVLILIGCWLSPPVLHWVAGPKYAGLDTLMRLQILTVLLTFLNSPVSLVIFAWGRSRTLTFINVIQLIVNLITGFWWIPLWGALGAILVTLAVNTVGLIMVYAIVGYELFKKAPAPTANT